MTSCLLLIDVQEGFITEETKHVIPRIEELLKNERFDHVAATRFINSENSPYRNILNWNKLVDSPETDLHPAVCKAADAIFEKDVYTAVSGELLKYLSKNSIDELFIAGIDTDCCVLKTAADLFEKNIRPKVLAYYSASNGGRKSHDAALCVLHRLVGKDNVIDNKF
jgi:Amidases related to nicotinamidase